MKFSNVKKENGVVSLITLLGLSVVSLAILSNLSLLAIDELKMANQGGVIDNTFYAAESGLNEGLYRLITNPIPGTHSFTIDGVNIEITVDTNPLNPYQRIIKSKAISPTGKIRIVQIVANTSSFAGGFDYAVQGGTGGIHLDNNSEIEGGVYSNGSIVPASTCPGGESSKPYIDGNVWAADNNLLNCVKIDGEVRVNTINRSIINGNAYYQTIDGITKVNGSVCPNSSCIPGSPDPPNKPLPLNDTIVNDWKTEITNAGNPVLSPTPAICPVGYTNTYCVMADTALGAQKIEGDIYIDNGVTLTLKGNLWVTGKVIFRNNGKIRIATTAEGGPIEGGSVVIITDNIVDVGENFNISGQCDPITFVCNQSSFVLVVSVSTDVGVDPAIYASNNSDSIVFAALHGTLKVKNNGFLNAAAAETLYLEPNSTVTYNPMLASFTVPGGGGEQIGTALGSWQEL